MNPNILQHQKLAAFLKSQLPNIIRPAGGAIPNPYLIPGGFYTQQWDWDAFFMALHLSNRQEPKPVYFKYWVENFLSVFDPNQETPACVREDSKVLRHSSLILKPFMAQGASRYALAAKDREWVKKVLPKVAQTVGKWESARQDAPTGLFFWRDAMMSGADNNPAVGNGEKDRNQVLACDASAFMYGEYLALSSLYGMAGEEAKAEETRAKAGILKQGILARLWDKEKKCLYNRRRDTAEQVRILAYSNFVPLAYGILPEKEGREMLDLWLWNEETMLSPHGLRSLSRQEPLYNNECIIVPYSNWQGPVWSVANFLMFQALKKYGFEKQAQDLAHRLAATLEKDLEACGSLHENYDAETGRGLAPSAAQNNGKEGGFVSWNLLSVDMLENASF